jgi:hypothetical protein
MNPEKTQAATKAAARVVSPVRLYRPCTARSITVNEILARLLFSVESPHTTLPERQSVLNVIDDLIRFKLYAGLPRGDVQGERA